MRRILLVLILPGLLPALQAQEKPAPVRICVATLQNQSRNIVNPGWQRDQLVKALERTNKSKEVKKGKAPRVEVVALESSGYEPDTTVREKKCEFVVRTTLTEVMRAGTPSVSLPHPGAVAVGTGPGDPRAYPEDYNTATVNYDLLRAGDPKPWTTGMVTAEDRLSEDVLVSQLMDQVAHRVVSDLRKPHANAPE